MLSICLMCVWSLLNVRDYRRARRDSNFNWYAALALQLQAAIENRNHNQNRNRLSMPTCNDMLTSNDNLIEQTSQFALPLPADVGVEVAQGLSAFALAVAMFIWERILEWSAWFCNFNCLGINKMACSKASSNNVNVQQIPKQTNKQTQTQTQTLWRLPLELRLKWSE